MTVEKLQDVYQLFNYLSWNGVLGRDMGQINSPSVHDLKGQYEDYTIEGVWVSSSSLKRLIKLVAQTSISIWRLHRWPVSATFSILHSAGICPMHLWGNHSDH